MGVKRKENMAKRIQKDLDDQGKGEEVDPDTIDWLSGNYKTRAQVEQEKQREESLGGAAQAEEDVSCGRGSENVFDFIV